MRDLRWNCADKGCFRTICPKLGTFDECFSGKIGMSDIDGVVEINGRFLFMEWKSAGGSVGIGQRILFERLTALSHKITTIVVNGNAREMEIQTIQVFNNGHGGKVETCDIGGLKERIAAWAVRAKVAP